MSTPVQKQTIFETLHTKRERARKNFARKHKKANIWLKKNKLPLAKLRSHSKKILASATIGGTLLVGIPQIAINPRDAKPTPSQVPNPQPLFNKEDFLSNLSLYEDRNKLLNEAPLVKNIIKTFWNIDTKVSLDNKILPSYYGTMGLEQHLVRFPGDTLSQHGELIDEGMAPARGAFGFFETKDIPKEDAADNEKYYIVLQTFLIPEWNEEWVHLKEWYKFRKFLVINPENGKAVVAVLGDSGPGESTRRVFGGSPEVMHELGFYPGRKEGDVMVLFLDDPNDTIPLGLVKKSL